MTAVDRAAYAELRQAAETLRQRAEAACCRCGSSTCTPANGWYRMGEASKRLDDDGAALFVTTMTPAVGLALADWLAKAAQDVEDYGPIDEPEVADDEDLLNPHLVQALTLARLVNGTS